MESISASGYVVPPFVIFEGQQIEQSWLPDNIDNSNIVIQVSPDGWTDGSIALDWLKHFNDYTAPHTVGKHRLLILDGHASYVSPAFVELCANNSIIPLCLPPHSAHVLQPLDVGIFGPLAQAYCSQIIKGSSVSGAVRIDNRQFLEYYRHARMTIRRNIRAAWRATGLVPYRPKRVLDALRPKTPPTAASTVTPTTPPAVTPPRAVTPTVAPTVPSPAPLTKPASGNMLGKGDVANISAIVGTLLEACASPLKKQVVELQDALLGMQAKNLALRALNSQFLAKPHEGRRKARRKHVGEAKVLTVEATRVIIHEQTV